MEPLGADLGRRLDAHRLRYPHDLERQRLHLAAPGGRVGRLAGLSPKTDGLCRRRCGPDPLFRAVSLPILHAPVQTHSFGHGGGAVAGMDSGDWCGDQPGAALVRYRILFAPAVRIRQGGLGDLLERLSEPEERPPRSVPSGPFAVPFGPGPAVFSTAAGAGLWKLRHYDGGELRAVDRGRCAVASPFFFSSPWREPGWPLW